MFVADDGCAAAHAFVHVAEARRALLCPVEAMAEELVEGVLAREPAAANAAELDHDAVDVDSPECDGASRARVRFVLHETLLRWREAQRTYTADNR